MRNSLFIFTLLLTSLNLFSSSDAYHDFFRPPTFSDYGTIGLLNMPSARILPSGSLAFHWSGAQPYFRGSIVATPFSWLEALYKYTDINDRPYSNFQAFSGGQSLKDKAFDAKFVLLKESDYFPQIALGFRDLGGTNRFAAEYVVATKMFKSFDFTLGMGWGTLSGGKNFRNPLAQIHKSFEIRGNSGEQGAGGKFSPDAWLSGDRASLFGGLEYFPKFSSRLRIKAEFDSTDFQREGERPLPQKSRLNYGVSYNFSRTINLHAGYIRGNTLQFGFTFKGNFFDRDPYKIKNDPIVYEEENRGSLIRNISKRNERVLYLSTLEQLRQNEIYLQSAEITDKEIHVVYSQSKHNQSLRAAGRASKIINQLANEEIELIKLTSLNGPALMHTVEIPRNYLNQAISDNDYQTLSYVSNIKQSDFDWKNFEHLPKAIFPVIDYGFTPAIRSHIGGPDGFYFGQLYIRGDAKFVFSRNLSLTAMTSLEVYNNFGTLKLPSDSILPHVRTDIVDYLKGGNGFSITRLQLDHLMKPFKNVYTRLSLGLFEEMYGGIGAEILYRPFASPFALGFEINNVTQRDFNQMFDFRDYDVTTGHLSAYYKHINSGVLFTLKGGRFLAKDSGFTFDFSRRFKSGMYVGAFFTLTDISAEEFGEGSFDKGFYFSFPIDIFFQKYSPGRTYFGLKPLTRDGGASVVSGMSLYGITDSSNLQNLSDEWDTFYD